MAEDEAEVAVRVVGGHGEFAAGGVGYADCFCGGGHGGGVVGGARRSGSELREVSCVEMLEMAGWRHGTERDFLIKNFGCQWCWLLVNRPERPPKPVSW